MSPPLFAFLRTEVLLIFLLVFSACSRSSFERQDTLGGALQVDSAWKNVVFAIEAEATFNMNELRLLTSRPFHPGEDNQVLEAESQRPVGLEVILVSAGGQEYALTSMATGGSKDGPMIIATSDALRSNHTGNKWLRMKIRSDRPLQVESVQWYTCDSKAMNYP